MNQGKISVTRGKGIHISFPSGFTVSIQFGPGNCCDHQFRNARDEVYCGAEGSTTAECVVWKDKGLIPIKNGNPVQGFMSMIEVLGLLNQAAKGEINEQI